MPAVRSVRNIESFQSLCSSIRSVTMIKFLRPISYVHLGILCCIFSISFEFCYLFYFLSVFLSFVILEYHELAIFHLFLCFFKLKGFLLLSLLRLNDIFRSITGH